MCPMPLFLWLLPRDTSPSPESGAQGSLHAWSHGNVVIGVTPTGVHTPVSAPTFVPDARGHLYIAWVW